MIKVLSIAWKDLLMLVRDRAAMILMLVAPFALTLGLGAVSGGFSGSSSAIKDIPVIVINQDRGELGGLFLQTFDSEGLAELFSLEVGSDLIAARQRVRKRSSSGIRIDSAWIFRKLAPRSSDWQNG